MKAKAEYTKLAEGSLVIESEIFGKWEISNINGEISVSETDKDADVTLEGYSVYPFVFGTCAPIAVDADEKTAFLSANWFPLPLYCPYLS